MNSTSPRAVPRALLPEILHPTTGDVLYVVELPDR